LAGGAARQCHGIFDENPEGAFKLDQLDPTGHAQVPTRACRPFLLRYKFVPPVLWKVAGAAWRISKLLSKTTILEDFPVDCYDSQLLRALVSATAAIKLI
jgi:hypothetical protein